MRHITDIETFDFILTLLDGLRSQSLEISKEIDKAYSDNVDKRGKMYCFNEKRDAQKIISAHLYNILVLKEVFEQAKRLYNEQ